MSFENSYNFFIQGVSQDEQCSYNNCDGQGKQNFSRKGPKR
jgi:hypothetical protein